MSLRAAAPDAQRAKQAFLSHVRHELRTPVNAVLGYSELMLEEHPGAGFRDELSRIQAAGREVVERIGLLLDASDVEALDAARVSAILRRVRRGLRAPTAAVIGGTRRLLEQGERLPEGVREDLAKVLAAAGRLAALLADLVSLARAAAVQVDSLLPDARYGPLVEAAAAAAGEPRDSARSTPRPARDEDAPKRDA
jgi:signal transduction histidine kinase